MFEIKKLFDFLERLLNCPWRGGAGCRAYAVFHIFLRLNVFHRKSTKNLAYFPPFFLVDDDIFIRLYLFDLYLENTTFFSLPLMSLKYACVVENSVIVASYPLSEQPQHDEVIQKLISCLHPNEYSRKTLEDDMGAGVNYHCLTNGQGGLFVCATTPETSTKCVFRFLGSLEQSYTSVSRNEKESRELLRAHFEEESEKQSDKFAHLNREIDSVKDIMIRNVHSVIGRGEQLETMAQKSADLAHEATKFQKSALRLRRSEWIKKAKTIAFGIFFLLVLLLILLMIICKPNFSRCF